MTAPALQIAAVTLPPSSFPPTRRLRHKIEFDRVYRDGRRFTDSLFALSVRHNNHGEARLGLSIAARVIGGAVKRNRLKRLIRESFRTHHRSLPNVDIVVNARTAAREADNAQIAQSLAKHWLTVKTKCASS